MVVMPVSMVNTGVSANNISFSGRNKRNVNVEAENSPVENSSKASKLAKVPVVVMIAMSPAMMNGKLPAEGLPDMNGAKVEYVTPTPEMTEELLAMATPAEFEAPQVNQANSDPMGISEFRYKKIQQLDSFNKNGKKHYIAYTTKRREPGEVQDVYLFPAGYKSEPGKKFIPVVQKLIYHDLGSGKEFCGVVVATSVKNLQTNQYETSFEEVRLPDECAQHLIDLLANDTKWTNTTSIRYAETKSSKLQDTYYK